MLEVFEPGTSASVKVTISFNISQNDGGSALHLSGRVQEWSPISRNLIYIDDENASAPVIKFSANGSYSPKDLYFKNNIFYNLGEGNYATSGSNINYNTNILFGKSVALPEEAGKGANLVAVDPLFVSPGTATGRNDAEGFWLYEGSPAFERGDYESATSGLADFWSNSAVGGVYNIGPYDGLGIQKPYVDKSELEALVSKVSGFPEADYTSETWDPFEDALAEAEEVLADVTATQEAVDSAYEILEQAAEVLALKSASTEVQSVKINGGASLVTLNKGRKLILTLTIAPVEAVGAEVAVTSANKIVAAATAISGTQIEVSGLKAGTTILTVTCGGKKATITVRVS
jgi:hypothetical protein